MERDRPRRCRAGVGMKIAVTTNPKERTMTITPVEVENLGDCPACGRDLEPEPGRFTPGIGRIVYGKCPRCHRRFGPLDLLEVAEETDVVKRYRLAEKYRTPAAEGAGSATERG